MINTPEVIITHGETSFPQPKETEVSLLLVQELLKPQSNMIAVVMLARQIISTFPNSSVIRWPAQRYLKQENDGNFTTITKPEITTTAFEKAVRQVLEIALQRELIFASQIENIVQKALENYQQYKATKPPLR